MADEKKKNALLGKLLGKKRSEPVEEQPSFDESMEFNSELPQDSEENDYTPEWLADIAAESLQDPDEDISEALAELFGESYTENAESEPGLDIEGFEEIAAAVERDYELYNTENASLEVVDEGGYAEEPYENYVEEEYEDAPDEIEGSDEILDYEDTDSDIYEEAALHPEDEQSLNVDEDTANLLAALGYSEANKSSRLKAAGKDSQSSRPSDLSLAYGYDGKEYTSRSQTASIKSKYSRDKLNMIVRLGATALFAILLCVYDMFGNKFGGAIDSKLYPVVNIMMSLQILLFAAAFSVRKLISGLNAMLKGDWNVYSVTTAAVIIAVIYDIALAVAVPEAFTLYNFPAAVCLCLCAFHDYLVLEREICVFGRLTSWHRVATLERVDASALAAELGERGMGSSADTVGEAFCLRSGEFAENYFRHINRRHPLSKMLAFFVTPAVALALVLFFITLASDKSFIQAANAFVGVALFSMPAFMLVSMSFPFYKLVTGSLRGDSVIMNEADVNEYSKVDTVVLEENDLFDDTSLTINRISVCDKNQMHDVFDILCAVSAMYDKIGGRIAGVFRASTADGEIPSDVSVVCVEDGGFIGVADGKYYCVGSDTYLTSKGISVTRYYDDKYIASNPGGMVLHIAVDGAEVFKLYLSYTMSPTALTVIDELAASKIRIILRTIDPNIDLGLISRILSSSFDGTITLVRKPYSDALARESSKNEENIEGGILVNGDSPEAILKTVRACSNFKDFSKFNFGVGIAVSAFGALLSFVLGLIGVIIDLPSVCVFIFQIISVLPSVFFASVYLNK